MIIKWFSDNSMFVNSKKFKEIYVNKLNESNHNCSLTINKAEIKSKKSVTLTGIEIDNKLNFEKHLSTICKKAKSKYTTKCNMKNRCTSTIKEKISFD